ncbi:hypothetical protein JHT90_13080 [Entomomonas asaccharolytica]|uniref:Uncharacterized protein n=2 Tax=Entomomonas asaccharolytica TaxID=2785331 RepID=A0A974NEI5_9GAMM|nr:hypothetical protein JHT90_13080 [Entomomonas asaccharolytica]
MKLNRELQDFAEKFLGRALKKEEIEQLTKFNHLSVPSEDEISHREMLVGVPNIHNLITILKAFQ